MTTLAELERTAREQWLGWGSYRKSTRCAGCRSMRYCCAHRPSGPFYCLDCFDFEVEPRRR